MANGTTVKERITRLETKVDDVMTNHLPHIQKKVDRIQWLIITTLVTVVVGLGFIIVK